MKYRYFLLKNGYLYFSWKSTIQTDISDFLMQISIFLNTHMCIYKQEVSLKKIIVEGYRAVGFLNDSFQSSNLLLFFMDFGQW